MSYLGDIALSQILYTKFTTVAAATGAPTTLSGSPAISVYKDDGTTESTAGITLTVDHDSRTGMNQVKIDTSADGTFYAAGHDFQIVITTGTVGGTSAVGYVIGEFSINNRTALRPATSGRTLVVDAAGLADANAVKVGPSGSGTAQTARDLGLSVLLSSGTGTGQLDFTSGVVKANLAQILGTALTETAGQIAGAFKKLFDVAAPTLTCLDINQTGDSYARLGAPAGASVSADVAAVKGDTAAIKLKTDNLPGSPAATGDAMALTALHSPNLESGTAQAGGASTITLRSGASATDSLYRGEQVEIYGGTGAGQARVITAYVGSTKVATVDEAWTTQPDNTSTYRLIHRSAKLDSSQQVVAASVQGNVTGSVASLTVNNDKTGYALTAGYDPAKTAAQAGDAMALTSGERTTLAAVIWNALTSGMTTAGSIGKRIVDFLTGDIYARLGAPAGVSLAADVAAVKSDSAAIKAKTDNLPASPAATGDAMAVTGDFSATMKSSLNAATPSVTVSDKTGFSLSAAGIQAIWDALTSALTTAGSIGKLLVTNVDAVISSRSAYAGGDTSGTTTLLSRIASALTITGGKVDVNDKTGFALTAGYDPAKTAAQAGDAMALTSGERTTLAASIWNTLTSGMTTAGSIGKRIVDFLTGDIYARLGAPAGASLAADVAAVKSDSAAIKAKTDNLPASPAATGDPMTLTSGERNSTADALLDRANGIETGQTPRQGLRLMLASLAGKLSGAATTTVSIRDTNDSKDRIVATVDPDGNRSSVTLDAS
jgi:hypothetical protein